MLDGLNERHLNYLTEIVAHARSIHATNTKCNQILDEVETRTVDLDQRDVQSCVDTAHNWRAQVRTTATDSFAGSERNQGRP